MVSPACRAGTESQERGACTPCVFTVLSRARWKKDSMLAAAALVCVCTQWCGPYCPLTPHQVHRIKLFRSVQEAKPALPDPKLPVSLYSAAA